MNTFKNYLSDSDEMFYLTQNYTNIFKTKILQIHSTKLKQTAESVHIYFLSQYEYNTSKWKPENSITSYY